MNGQNLSGQTLGQYELHELLGRGGMGAVYRAYQPTLDRHVAIKVMSLAISQEAGYTERFNREAKMAASLEHPNIVPVYDYGIAGEISYVVMRLLTGESLEQRIRNSALSLAEIAVILKQLASALDYAHSQNLIHRDIKPSNVMFDSRGTAYLVDFGIAKMLQSTQSLTARSMILGTPSYMSPEQWQDQDITAASDQYALAVLTYQLMTGELPFEATTPYALMNKHLNQAPKPPQVIRPEIPISVSLVVQRALSKSPTDRFASVGAFAAAFEAAIKDMKPNFAVTEANLATTPWHVPHPVPPTETPVPNPVEKTYQLPKTVSNRSDRTRIAAAVISVLVLVGLAAVLYPMLSNTNGSTPPTEVAQSGDPLVVQTEEATAEASEEPSKEPTITLTAPAAVTGSPASTAHTPTPMIQYVYITVEPTQCLTPFVSVTEDPNAEPTLTVSQNYRLGERAMVDSDYSAAVDYFSDTLRLDPMYVEAYYYRALNYVQLFEPELALADYDSAIELEPEFYDAYIARAEIRSANGDYSAALEDLNTAFDLSAGGGDAYLYYMRGIVYAELGRHEEAVDDFTRALRFTPDDGYMYGDRAWAYFELGNYEAAVSDFSAYLEYDSTSLEAYQGKGDAQINLGDFEGAVETFTAALELDENNVETLQQLADSLYQLERWDEALTYYTRYVTAQGSRSEEYVLERITELENAGQD